MASKQKGAKEPKEVKEGVKPVKGTAKRDELIRIQHSVQEQWNAAKVFEQDVPLDTTQPKFFATFPYPYMNGRLHLGHTFTLSRADFAVAYQRLKGKAVLFPFGLHCTGMPIKACADKLRREMEKFGCPPQFPVEEVAAAAPADEAAPAEAKPAAAAAEVKPAQKAKVAQKTGGEVYQWRIMESMGVPAEEIPLFANPVHWLQYFPPKALDDLKVMGAQVDYRRSFITTDVNPYYDSFVRWQFNKLKRLGKVELGTRYCIWSPLDGQQCGDHDRAKGEGAVPQEYTGIKMKVVEFPEALEAFKSRTVYFVAATLRPETMYGQTNFFVLPSGDYGVYEAQNDELYVISHHSARNMAFQGLLKTECKEPVPLAVMKGSALYGTGVSSPLAKYPVVYCLPMFNILMDKGTGVVTSVPSDAPDDYAALMDATNKRAALKLKDEWVVPFEVVPIIDIPEWGSTAAVVACQKYDIRSQNEREKLELAKKAVYKEGYYEGVMIVGPYAGRKVKDIKTVIKQELIDAAQAIKYSEPDREVISRSGDTCVVSLSEQWYLLYGEPEWQAAVKKCLSQMDLYSQEARDQFNIAVGWLREWACSREFGLGTRLPFDERYLIESLSDSTIYMAYYTVVHKLQGGVIDGSAVGPAGIRAEQLNDAVWEYIFSTGDYPAECGIPEATLAELRREFNYWYPFDVRVSGRDLIQNHLTMALYNHVALFPEHQWPKGFRANGFVQRDGEKMSKSKGNFLTLKDAVEKFSADGMRIGLAGAGDDIENANFVDDFADNGIRRLHAFLEWATEVVNEKIPLRTGPADMFFDKWFDVSMNKAIVSSDTNYERMLFREAVHTAFIDLQDVRDEYRVRLNAAPMHKDLLLRFIEVQALLIAPIAPHTAEHIWLNILKKPTSILAARWPQLSAAGVDITVLRAGKYIDDFVTSSRKKIETAAQPPKPKKGQAAEPAPPRPNVMQVYIAAEYPLWQRLTLTGMRALYDEKTGTFPGEKEFVGALRQVPELATNWKPVMPFAAMVKEDVANRGVDALALATPFDEAQLLRENEAYLLSALGLRRIDVYAADAPADIPDPRARRATAVPGKPGVNIFFEETAAAAAAASS